MSNRHAVIDSKPCHAHKCDYCKSAWMCQGVACLKKKHRTCYTCSSPEKVALRAEKKRQEMLRERQSGEQLYIFRARVGVAGLPAPAWFQANGFTFSGSPTPPYCACGALMTAKPWDHETTCPLYDYIYA